MLQQTATCENRHRRIVAPNIVEFEPRRSPYLWRERRMVSAASPGYHARMRVEGLLLDLDGTLYVGGEPVAGAREAVGRLAASGLALRYFTNPTRKPRRAVREQ